MRIVIGLAMVVFGLLLIGAAFWPIQMATVSLPKENNRLIAAVPVGNEDMIRLAYRHSVELTAVEGRFRVGPESEILAVETRMESVGTGLPNAVPERTRTENGWLVVDEGQKAVGTIRFFMVPINKTRLVIADRPIDLSRLKAGTTVQVSAERRSLISWLWKHLSG